MAVSSEFSPLLERFRAAFPRGGPLWCVRAPGRINLIGEHTDYNGFPVMPMAIDRAVRIVCAPRSDGAVELRDANEADYGPRRFGIARRIEPYEAGDWGNYVKAAVQGLVDHAVAAGGRLSDLRGMTCVVDGDIPVEAGLSSSTAVVVASALAFARVNGLHIRRRRMAELTAEAEHYVGTRGGGMDQAACLLGEEGKALKVDFFPLRAQPVPFPRDFCIVAAHSTVSARKSGGRREAYNQRVAECAVGVHILARALGTPPQRRLADLARLRPGLCPDEYLGAAAPGDRRPGGGGGGGGGPALRSRQAAAFRARYALGEGRPLQGDGPLPARADGGGPHGTCGARAGGRPGGGGGPADGREPRQLRRRLRGELSGAGRVGGPDAARRGRWAPALPGRASAASP